jgi:hypothetical protein
VRAAWQEACGRSAPRSPSLARALRDFARDGRARGCSVGSLLRALDTLLPPERGGDASLERAAARAWVGTEVIRSYYRDD